MLHVYTQFVTIQCARPSENNSYSTKRANCDGLKNSEINCNAPFNPLLLVINRAYNIQRNSRARNVGSWIHRSQVCAYPRRALIATNNNYKTRSLFFKKYDYHLIRKLANCLTIRYFFFQFWIWNQRSFFA